MTILLTKSTGILNERKRKTTCWRTGDVMRGDVIVDGEPEHLLGVSRDRS